MTSIHDIYSVRKCELMNQKQIFELMEKFKECELGALRLETEGFKISLKSNRTNLAPNQGTAAFIHSPESSKTAIVPEPTAAHGLEKGSEDSVETNDSEIITAPIVGSFYRSPGPDSPPFVEEGSLIEAGASICIIEAMKIMNKLEAEFACEIVRVLAENGQMVEYGAPLFEVRRT